MKGNAESSYRTGDVNLTPANIGAVAKSGDTMTGKLTLQSGRYTDNYTAGALDLQNSNIQGVNSIYTADASENAAEGIHFYRDATHVDSIHAANGKFYFTPNRQLGTSGTPSELYCKPPYAEGSSDFTVRPLIDRARANRLAFLPADQIIIEKTTDGGTTWVDAGVSDGAKRGLFSTGNGIAIPTLNGGRSELCGLRITITAMKYDVPSGTSETGKYAYWNSDHVLSAERYCSLDHWWFWMSAASDRIRCYIYRATGANPNTWTTVFNSDFRMSGWSGSDWIWAGGNATFGGSVGQTGNAWNWRLVFWSSPQAGRTEFTGTGAQTIDTVKAYGVNCWSSSNEMMRSDHLYSYNSSKDAVFPASIFPNANNSGSLGASTSKWASVYATTLYGNVTGNVTGNVAGGIRNSDTTIRPASANTTGYGAYLRYILATSSMTTGKPDGDAHILDMEWDNSSKWHGQLAIPTASTGRMQWRTENGGTWTEWRKVFDDAYAKNNTSNGALGWVSAANDVMPITSNTLAYWNGAYQNTTSNLKYCVKGEFGTLATKNSLSASDIPAHASTATTYGAASTSNYGHAKLSSATDSSSEALAATPKAVKAAYDLANDAVEGLSELASIVADDYFFKITYSISNGTTTCAAHVYSVGEEVTSTFADSCFQWYYNVGNGWVSLGTGKTKAVTALSDFGGNVKCDFTPPEE